MIFMINILKYVEKLMGTGVDIKYYAEVLQSIIGEFIQNRAKIT